MAAEVSGITNAELVIITEEDGVYGLDIRDSTDSLTNIVNKLDQYVDFSTFTKQYGMDLRKLWAGGSSCQFVTELNVQMNGKGGVGEYDRGTSERLLTSWVKKEF